MSQQHGTIDDWPRDAQGRLLRHGSQNTPVCQTCRGPLGGRKRFCSRDCELEAWPENAPKGPYFAATHEEIARELGCSRTLVQDIERSALRKIRRALEQGEAT